MDILFSMIAFFVLVASWFVLPSAPKSVTATAASTETLAPAA